MLSFSTAATCLLAMVYRRVQFDETIEFFADPGERTI